MNIHPLFVHFPIALLSIYAILEIFRVKILTRQSWYAPVKIFLLLIGAVAAIITRQTGEMAEDLVGKTQLTEMHELFATISTILFGVLAVCYFIRWWALRPNTSQGVLRLNRISAWIITPPLVILFALVGLSCIFITGALGGAIVYGPDADPFISMIYKLLF